MGPPHYCARSPTARGQIVRETRAPAVWFAEQPASIACAKAVISWKREWGGAPNRESFMNPEDIKTTVKTFILNEYLPGEEPSALTEDTPLMTTGILNSIE